MSEFLLIKNTVTEEQRCRKRNVTPENAFHLPDASNVFSSHQICEIFVFIRAGYHGHSLVVLLGIVFGKSTENFLIVPCHHSLREKSDFCEPGYCKELLEFFFLTEEDML